MIDHLVRYPVTVRATDWVGTVRGVELRSGRRRFGVDIHAIKAVYYDSGDATAYVQILVSNPRRVSSLISAVPQTAAVRRLPSLWDYWCVVHGASPRSTMGSCAVCGRASYLRIIWRDPDAFDVVIRVTVMRGMLATQSRQILQPGEVLEVYEDRAGNLYARVLSYELIHDELPPDLRPVEPWEIVGWTRPKEVVSL
ncbi:MAG: hypothetical protein QXP81_08570 [Nitrososphaerota archaeon]